MKLSGGVRGSVRMGVGSLSSVRSVGILRSLVLSRRIDQVLEILLVLWLHIVHRADSLQRHRPRRSSADRVERLTGVHAQGGQRDGPYQKRVLGVLLVELRGKWQHAITLPPSDERPRPAPCVAVQRYRRVHGDGYVSVRLSDDGRGQFFRFCIVRERKQHAEERNIGWLSRRGQI